MAKSRAAFEKETLDEEHPALDTHCLDPLLKVLCKFRSWEDLLESIHTIYGRLDMDNSGEIGLKEMQDGLAILLNESIVFSNDDWHELTDSICDKDAKLTTADGKSLEPWQLEVSAADFEAMCLAQLKTYLIREANKALIGGLKVNEALLMSLKWVMATKNSEDSQVRSRAYSQAASKDQHGNPNRGAADSFLGDRTNDLRQVFNVWKQFSTRTVERQTEKEGQQYKETGSFKVNTVTVESVDSDGDHATPEKFQSSPGQHSSLLLSPGGERGVELEWGLELVVNGGSFGVSEPSHAVARALQMDAVEQSEVTHVGTNVQVAVPAANEASARLSASRCAADKLKIDSKTILALDAKIDRLDSRVMSKLDGIEKTVSLPE